MRARWITAAVLAGVGAIWIGQGLGLLRGSSFMTDDIRWAVGGVALIAGAAAIGWWAVRTRPRP